MAESRILEILAGNTGENGGVCETLHFPRLAPDYVGHISKSIADILYGSLIIKSTLPVHKRLDILLLLRKWCTNSGYHFKVDHNNYDCLIGSLISVASHALSDDDDDLQVKITLDEEFDEICNLNVATSINWHYKRIEIVNSERAKLSELVRNRDYKKCGSDSVLDLNSPWYCQNKGLSGSFYGLEALNNEYCCAVGVNANMLNDRRGSFIKKSKVNLMREQQISLAYSLLNLEKSNGGMSLLAILLKNLSSYEDLEIYEIKFVDYLWQKSMDANLPSKMLMLLLETSAWIYERCITKICKDMLLVNTRHLPYISEEAFKILQLSSKSEKLRSNIMNLFYELFACSDYSSKLHNFLRITK